MDAPATANVRPNIFDYLFSGAVCGQQNGTGAAVSIIPAQQNREFWRRNREFHLPKPKSSPDEFFDPHKLSNLRISSSQP
jgi:hypothetical protein